MKRKAGDRPGIRLPARHWAPVLALSLALPTVFLHAQDRDARNAEPYLERARALLDSGSGARALEMADQALLFDPGSSEAHYLRALVLVRDQALTAGAVRSLERALSSSQWSRTDPDDALRLLAGILVRSGRPRDATAQLEALSARHPENPDDALLLVRAYGKAGDRESERRALDAASLRFPRNAPIALYRIEGMLRSGAAAAAREELRKALSWAGGDPDILLLRARMEEDPARRRSYVDAYIRQGGSDPSAANLALSASPADPAFYASFFLAHGGWTDGDAADRFLALLCAWPQALGEAEKALAAWSGAMDLDRDRDGSYEERRIYEKGIAVRWIADADQDGNAEFVAELENGSVKSLLHASGPRESWRFLYGIYPFVEGVEDLSREGRTLYRLAPFALGIPVLDAETGGSEPAGPRPVPLPPYAAQVVAAAYALEEYAAGTGRVLRRTELKDGHPVYREEDADGDGRMDRRIWFSRGLPVRGLRDPAGDGTFPAAEEYGNGQLVRLAVDTDGDGRTDYAEEFEAGIPAGRSWDYDGDGVFDARERPSPSGGTVREFSTGRDGVFDLVTSFHGADLVEVRKNGRLLPVETDPATGIRWIGAHASRPDLAGFREGYRSIGGKTYLLFIFQGGAYVEELQ